MAALETADWLSLRAVWIGGTLIFAAALLVSADVIARKVLGVTFGGADELSGYAFAIGTTWALAFTLLRRANVRVDALYQHLPPKLCALLDILALVALGVFAGLLARYGFEVASESFTRNALSNTQLKVPLWIPQGLWFLGLALFVTTLGLLLLRGAHALVTSDWVSLQALFGARTIHEDAQEEAAYAREVVAKDVTKQVST